MLENCSTLMLDMDGTVLDLAYDNYMWLQHVPMTYAQRNNLSIETAKHKLYSHMQETRGSLDWYCLDYWSEFLGFDVVELHRVENHRIGFLPGAEEFLAEVGRRDIRVIMVTNSHLGTLKLKDEVTEVTRYFDHVYSSHEFGEPKESQIFWQALREQEGFDPGTSLFVDDSHAVLESAKTYGIAMLVNITQPDTSMPEQDRRHFAGVSDVGAML